MQLSIGGRQEEPLADLGHRRILVVDDASLVRLYYRDALQRGGFEIDEALNGVEALERIVTGAYELLIVDVNMPQMDGLTFLRTLRRHADRDIASLPVIVVSTEAEPRDAQAARAAGANFYLIKPATQDILLALAVMLCGGKA